MHVIKKEMLHNDVLGKEKKLLNSKIKNALKFYHLPVLNSGEKM